MIRKAPALLLLLAGGFGFAPGAAAQTADCAQWSQRLQARADAFDARCTRVPMTIGGPQWNACQAEQSALLAERDRWIAACRR